MPPTVLLLFSLLVATSSTSAKSTPDNACSSGECPAPPLSSVFVLGDLHGDVQCAISWVNRTGLVGHLFDAALASDLSLHRRLNPPSRWTWADPRSTLLFLGDYVDKGPTSRQTVRFVRDLTVAFPHRVTALLGNHELELLRDRDARIEPQQRYGSYSYAAVHPGEYHNYFRSDNDEDVDDHPERTDTDATAPRSLDSDDVLVLNLLYEATMEVYSYGAHDAVRFVPSLPPPSDDNARRGVVYAITDVIPPQHRSLAKQRLEEYQEAYLDSYRSGTVLGSWLETRPILHFEEHVATLFVHGGVSPHVAKMHLTNGKESVDAINSIWRQHSAEETLYDFLGSSAYGPIVYGLLTHRGNHPGYSKWETDGRVDDRPVDEEAVCADLKDMLAYMKGIERIAVGHTPDFTVRRYCDDAFLALDSMLGRGIRATGNEYCPWPGQDGGDIPKISRNGKYKCDDVPESCHGETVRIDSDGTVNVLTL